MIDNPTHLEIYTNGFLGYWVEKLLPDKVVIIKSSNKIDAHMMCIEHKNVESYTILYNPERIADWDIPMVINGVFHEIGHIKHGWDGPNKNNTQDVIDEYVAERYAVDMIKKYYPRCLANVVKYIKDEMAKPDKISQMPVHFLAYSQIEEYQ